MNKDVNTAQIVNARCTIAMIRALGMQAENMQREHIGQSMAYSEKDFVEIIVEEQIHWNAIYELLYC